MTIQQLHAKLSTELVTGKQAQLRLLSLFDATFALGLTRDVQESVQTAVEQSERVVRAIFEAIDQLAVDIDLETDDGRIPSPDPRPLAPGGVDVEAVQSALQTDAA